MTKYSRRPPSSPIQCSFCGKSAEQVQKIVTGPGVYICNECIAMCQTLINEQPTAPKSGVVNLKDELSNLAVPAEIVEHLNQHVIGQDIAKKSISVAVYNHYKRTLSQNSRGVVIDKSNILFLGPTGSGKTLIAQTLAKYLKLPFTIVDATVLTEAGYVGEDVDNILVRLLQAADYDVKKAEQGIIFVDEIDKISRRSANPSITRDVSGEGVQQGLLKLLEGTVAAVPPKGGRKHPEQPLVQIDTKNILFICGGAFEHLDKIIRRRIHTNSMGFGTQTKAKTKISQGDILRMCEPDDLIEFGLIPEIVGRLPVTVGLDELDEKSLLRILTEPKNSLIKQYKKLFEIDGVRLTFTDEALLAIVKKTISRKTGARGLRSILESSLMEIMYELPSKKDISECIITEEVIEKGSMPKLRKKVRNGKKIA